MSHVVSTFIRNDMRTFARARESPRTQPLRREELNINRPQPRSHSSSIRPSSSTTASLHRHGGALESTLSTRRRRRTRAANLRLNRANIVGVEVEAAELVAFTLLCGGQFERDACDDGGAWTTSILSTVERSAVAVKRSGGGGGGGALMMRCVALLLSLSSTAAKPRWIISSVVRALARCAGCDAMPTKNIFF